MDRIQISAKSLGEFSLPEFCPRCAWIKLRLKNRLPFQIFPGIFSSIDSYNKKVVHGWFDRHGSAPPWLGPLGPITGYREPPHHSKFRLLDQTHDVMLTGSPDGVLSRPDGSHVIVDYKTAKFTGNQDELYPMYETQLNVYAQLGNALGLSPVAALALIYMEPVTDDAAAAHDFSQREHGFALGFRATILDVPIKPGLVAGLVAKVREVYDYPQPPPVAAACRNCSLLEGVVALLGE